MGAAAGLGGSLWAQRRLRRTVGRYLPERVGSELTRKARYLRDDVRDALDEGRSAMRTREHELRQQLGVPVRAAPAPPDSRRPRRHRRGA